MAQKEEILEKVLQLGGDNYTFSDIRKDLSSFEWEDKTFKNTLIGNKSYEDEDKMTEVHRFLTKKLLQELEIDEKEIEESNKAETVKSA